MSETQRLQLYAIVFSGVVLLLTYFNFSRYSELASKRLRVQSSLENCVYLQGEFGKLSEIPETFPFLHDIESVELDVRNKLAEAGLSNNLIEVKTIDETPIAESGYQQVSFRINIRSELNLEQFLRILWVIEASGPMEQAEGFWVESFRLVDTDGKPTFLGTSETWRCRELILSCLTIPVKSP